MVYDKQPKVSLVMCTLGRTDQILRLIESLEGQTRGAFELIIVDQNPPGTLDALVERARCKLAVTYLRSEPGLSRARNAGLRVCSGAIIAFPDDDCWYPADLVDCVSRLFDEHPELGIVTGRTTDAKGNDSNGKYLRSSCEVTRRNVWYCGTSNSVFARLDLVQQLHGFNESLGVGANSGFGSGEETDLILRALAKGHRAAFFHELIAHHDQTNRIFDEPAFRRAADYARGFGRVMRLNHYSLAYALLRSARSMLAALIACGRPNMAQARLKWLWARQMLAGYLAPTSGA
jgi:glycosyltransferase involved in cell wall biosynthesis